jgi:hypothetical protein
LDILNVKKTAILANKESKFNVMQDKITDELHKRFEINKMNINFKKDFEQDKRKIWRAA